MNWTYRLTVEQEALAARIGYERQLPYLGKPERNRNYSEGDIWEIWQHAIAAGAEIAAAEMLGVRNFVPHVNVFKSRQDIPGYEVRYAFSSQRGQSLRYSAKVDNKEEIYILLGGGPEQRTRRTAEDNYEGPAYYALGWLYGYECEQPQYLYQGHSYYVPWRDLNPMESLPRVP